jgi:hypothetical protein
MIRIEFTQLGIAGYKAKKGHQHECAAEGVRKDGGMNHSSLCRRNLIDVRKDLEEGNAYSVARDTVCFSNLHSGKIVNSIEISDQIHIIHSIDISPCIYNDITQSSSHPIVIFSFHGNRCGKMIEVGYDKQKGEVYYDYGNCDGEKVKLKEPERKLHLCYK